MYGEREKEKRESGRAEDGNLNGDAMSSPTTLPPTDIAGESSRLWFAEATSFRTQVLVQALAKNLSPQCEARHFSTLCLSLSTELDFAVDNNYKPACVQHLFWLIKQVCQQKKDLVSQAAVLVLLLSLKNASSAGWFSSSQSQELSALVDEVAGGFCTARNLVDQANILSFMSQVSSRFYPWLKLGRVFASLEVKPGFGAYVVDFHIPKNTPCNDEEIRLLVAMKDDIDTSTCLISPNKAEFLLNGKGVDGRTSVMMDPGPQLPTLVEPILKCGANLLQAVGQFDGKLVCDLGMVSLLLLNVHFAMPGNISLLLKGHYVMLVALVSSMPFADLPAPPDYVEPALSTADSDSDIIEGPSLIKLICPISLSRIKFPVKGHMCKHRQCFDLTVFVEINLKRPSWRCPHCNRSVCYTDIRIDRSMLTILQEVEENVSEVIIFEDGSWKAVSSTSNRDKPDVSSSACLKERAEPQDMPSGFSRGSCDIYDLTEGDEMYVQEFIDNKIDSQNNTSTVCSLSVPLVPLITTEASQSSTDTEDGVSSSGLSSNQVSPALNQGPEGFQSSNIQPNPRNMEQPANVNDLQLQQSQLSQSIMSNDNGSVRYSAIPRKIYRIPNAVQALPVQMMAPCASISTSSRPYPSVPVQTTAPTASIRAPSRPFVPVQTTGPTASIPAPSRPFAPVQTTAPAAGIVSPQPLVRNITGSSMRMPYQSIAIGSSSSESNLQQQQYTSQPMLHQWPASQIPQYRTSFQVPNPSFGLSSSTQSSNMTNTVTHWMPQMVSPAPHLRSSQVVRPQFPPPVTAAAPTGVLGNQAALTSQQHIRHMGCSSQQLRQPQIVPVQIQSSRSDSLPSPMNVVNHVRARFGEQHEPASRRAVQLVTRTEDLLDVQAEQNWRPQGRMRGSLSGRDAFGQCVIRPTGVGGAPTPRTSTAAEPLSQNNMAPHLQALLANRNLYSSQSQNNGGNGATATRRGV